MATSDEIEVGPTGVFPAGEPSFDGDQGSLHAGFIVLKNKRLCALNFGTLLTHVVTTKKEAVLMATLIREEIAKNFDDIAIGDRNELPIGIEVFDSCFVKVTMPESLEFLIMNPEAFIVLADRIEEEAAKIYEN